MNRLKISGWREIAKEFEMTFELGFGENIIKFP
jgi:hypothetical protein